MALGSEMDDTVYLLVLHKLIESVKVADVHLDKLIIGLVLDVLEVGEVAGICQLVEIDDLILWVFVHEEANHMRANKASAASYYNITFHINYFFSRIGEFENFSLIRDYYLLLFSRIGEFENSSLIRDYYFYIQFYWDSIYIEDLLSQN